jgi:hypothetical protein
MALEVQSRAPMAKQRAQLQRGRFPRNAYAQHDPDEPIRECDIRRTIVGENPGAVPSEALQYDLVYIAFRNDTDFREHWKVVDCARCGKEESISQKNAYIRVVMDLPKEVKLYPTAYTPGFPTVPRNKTGEATRERPKIPGLPEGYSVALDVYILEDAKILLEHQRAFRGRVDPKYRWLDEIVNKDSGSGYAEETMNNELAMIEVTPMDSTVVHKDKHWTWHGGHIPQSSDLHQVLQPAAADPLPLSCFHACPRGLQKDSRREYTCVVTQRDGDLFNFLGAFAEKHELTPAVSSLQGYDSQGNAFGDPPTTPESWPLKFVWSMEGREEAAFVGTGDQAASTEPKQLRRRGAVDYDVVITWEEYQQHKSSFSMQSGLQKISATFESQVNPRDFHLWCFDVRGRPFDIKHPPERQEQWPATLVWKHMEHMHKAHMAKVRQEQRRQIHEETALINAFGDHVGLPKRDMGTWGKVEDGSAAARRKELDEETARLDKALEDLKAKTTTHVNALADA